MNANAHILQFVATILSSYNPPNPSSPPSMSLPSILRPPCLINRWTSRNRISSGSSQFIDLLGKSIIKNMQMIPHPIVTTPSIYKVSGFTHICRRLEWKQRWGRVRLRTLGMRETYEENPTPTFITANPVHLRQTRRKESTERTRQSASHEKAASAESHVQRRVPGADEIEGSREEAGS